MFPAFLPFFKRVHAASSSEPKSMTVDQLRESVSQVMQSLATDPSAAQGLKAEMLSDMSNWSATAARDDHPAKYEAFAARVTRIGAPSPTTDEFTLMTPAASIPSSTTPSTNSFTAFAARVPESVQHALGEMHAEKPTAPRSEQVAGEPTSPTLEPPQTHIPSKWDTPPLR